MSSMPAAAGSTSRSSTDQGMITSRHPGDIDAFVAKIIEEVEEGVHRRAA